LDVFKPDAPLLCPALDVGADVLRAVVAADDLRPAAPGNDPKSGSYPVAGSASMGLDGPNVGAILSLT
jgi:hypothetical protein